MKISIITLFPQIFEDVLNTSMTWKAQKDQLVQFEIINLRGFGEGQHKTVDGRPYGGGAGMILKADILTKALGSIGKKSKKTAVVLTSPAGQTYTQQKARELSKMEHLIIVCGHYEGIDQRFVDKYIDESISIGDYILTGGEIPALVIADSVTRLIPGVLKKEEATTLESFENGSLEHPHYTRPDDFEGVKVPQVLLSGDHQAVDRWREEQSLMMTKKIRPDLIKKITEKD